MLYGFIQVCGCLLLINPIRTNSGQIHGYAIPGRLRWEFGRTVDIGAVAVIEVLADRYSTTLGGGS